MPKKWQRGASIPSQFQRGISRLVKKQGVRVSAWSRAQVQRGDKFQRGAAFSMLKLEHNRGSGKNERFFSEIDRAIIKFYQSDGQEAALTRLLIQRGGTAADPPYDSRLEAHMAKRYAN